MIVGVSALDAVVAFPAALPAAVCVNVIHKATREVETGELCCCD